MNAKNTDRESAMNIDTAAANLAALRCKSFHHATKLNEDDTYFADVAEQMAESLDNTGSFDALPFAEIHDAAYTALAEQVDSFL